MNKTVLGVAMVVVFCITFWMVAGEAWQASQKAEQAYEPAQQAEQARKEAYQRVRQQILLTLLDERKPRYPAYKAVQEQINKAASTEEVAAIVEAYNQAERQAEEAAKQAGPEEAAKQAERQREEAVNHGKQKMKQAVQAHEDEEVAWQAAHPEQAGIKQASIMADAHWRTQRSWGIGAGLFADVLLLVGALAWSKLTAKP